MKPSADDALLVRLLRAETTGLLTTAAAPAWPRGAHGRLVLRGLLRRTPAGSYVLTAAGRERAAGLEAAAPPAVGIRT